MSTKNMMVGQLYRAGVTCINARERCTLELLLVAESTEDAAARLPWVYDFSGWDSHRIDWITKEPGRCVALRTKFERASDNEPDASIQRADGSRAVFQRPPLQCGKKFDVKAATVLYAKSPEAARRKLAERISGGSEFVKIAIEELAEVSPYAVARDVSIFPRASFVRA